MTNATNGDEIRAFIERYEQLEAEKAIITDNMKEVMQEAKGRGYSVAVLRKIIAQRKKDRDALAEEQAIMAIYLDALGGL